MHKKRSSPVQILQAASSSRSSSVNVASGALDEAGACFSMEVFMRVLSSIHNPCVSLSLAAYNRFMLCQLLDNANDRKSMSHLAVDVM
jgi:hypothetical protein